MGTRTSFIELSQYGWLHHRVHEARLPHPRNPHKMHRKKKIVEIHTLYVIRVQRLRPAAKPGPRPRAIRVGPTPGGN
jgi:hypothetical protein